MSNPAWPVLALSRDATGARSNVVWGVAWLVVIESLVVATLLVGYFYLRMGVPSWPPGGIPLPAIGLSTISTGLLVVSVLPIAAAIRGIAAKSRRRALVGTRLGLVLLVAYLVMSMYSLRTRPYSWKVNSYGSIVWAMEGYQLMHAMALFVLWSAMIVLLRRGEFDDGRHAPLQAAAIYWYFAAASGSIVHATIYFSPRFMG